MARGDRVTDRVLARIAESEHRLTVYYPATPATPISPTPGALPVAPLMRAANPTLALEEPVRGPCVPCLFTEVGAMSDARAERLSVALGGWSREVTALARVGPEIACEGGRTHLDGASYVEVDTRRFRVVNVVPMRASTTKRCTYYVMLTGASRQ